MINYPQKKKEKKGRLFQINLMLCWTSRVWRETRWSQKQSQHLAGGVVTFLSIIPGWWLCVWINWFKKKKKSIYCGSIHFLKTFVRQRCTLSLSPITSPIMKRRLMPQAMRSFLLARRLVSPLTSGTDPVTWQSCSCCRRPTRLDTSSLHSDDESELFSSAAPSLNWEKSAIIVKGFWYDRNLKSHQLKASGLSSIRCCFSDSVENSICFTLSVQLVCQRISPPAPNKCYLTEGEQISSQWQQPGCLVGSERQKPSLELGWHETGNAREHQDGT